MARGYDFPTDYSHSLMGPGNTTGCVDTTTNAPTNLTEFVLKEFGIDWTGVLAGNSLPEYDVKSQDAAQVLKLSLLASSNGNEFNEVYIRGDGLAVNVQVGFTQFNPGGAGTLMHRQIIHVAQEPINNVVAHAKAPLPERVHGPTVDLMGLGSLNQFSFTCPYTYNPKDNNFKKEAWVEFPRSEHSEITRLALKAAVDRENWESLIGYRAQFADIDIWAVMNPSPTSAARYSAPVADEVDIYLTLDNTPDSGGAVDISGVSMAAAPVLDIRLGSELIPIAASLGVPDLTDDSLSFFDENAWYVLLAHECGLSSLGRGTNWFLLATGNPTVARIAIRQSAAEGPAAAALNGVVYDSYGIRPRLVYRSDNKFISSFEDIMNANALQGQALLGSSFGVAKADPSHGALKAGMGGNMGLEIWTYNATYTKQRASIQVRSQNNDALTQANKIRIAGVQYTPLIMIETPASAGLAGEAGTGPIEPEPPHNDETDQYCPETVLDTLKGSVLEVSTPWLDASGAQDFANKLYTLILSEYNNTVSSVSTLAETGYSALPGMLYNNEVIHSVEFGYSDRDSQTTTITTGPKFFQAGGAGSDSKYIKRSETINKPGVVIGGNNESGTFSVQVEGLGIYEAINGQIDTVYPGDRVDIKIMNFPVER